MGPRSSASGTVALISESFTIVNCAGLKLNDTPVADEKPEPSMVTMAPAAADAGLKELMLGEGRADAWSAGMTNSIAAAVVIAALTVAMPRNERNILRSSACWPLQPVCLQGYPLRRNIALRHRESVLSGIRTCSRSASTGCEEPATLSSYMTSFSTSWVVVYPRAGAG